MPQLNSLSASSLLTALRSAALPVCIGPYTYKLHSNLPVVAEGISTLYSDFPMAGPEGFVDFNIAVRYAGLSERLREKCTFYFDNQTPFTQINFQQAYASLEWGMNWCVSIHANEYLKLHAAVIAKEGKAVVLPGIPGAGKSTLCAAMGLSGWRILSDEHALILPGKAEVVPLCRPVSLKNESISLIKSFASKAVFGPTSNATHKGIVAHMKADMAPHSHDSSPLPVTNMVFPRYSAQDTQGLFPRSRTQSFILAAYHSFNYSLLGSEGFKAMVTLIDAVQCYDLVYKDLEWAIKTMDQLHDGLTG